MHRVHLNLALFPIYFLSVIIKEGGVLAAQRRLNGWTVNGLPAALRLQRYLARALAWPDLAFDREFDALAKFEFFPAC